MAASLYAEGQNAAGAKAAWPNLRQNVHSLLVALDVASKSFSDGASMEQVSGPAKPQPKANSLSSTCPSFDVAGEAMYSKFAEAA